MSRHTFAYGNRACNKLEHKKALTFKNKSAVGAKSLQMVTAAMKLKDAYSLEAKL